MDILIRLRGLVVILLASTALFVIPVQHPTPATVIAPLTPTKSQTAATTKPGGPLKRENFRMVATTGFGDRGNTWAWTSGYINNRIVVGTGRWVTCATVYNSGGTPPPAMQCPAQSQIAAAQQAQIWSADASVGHPLTQADWSMDYQAPLMGGIPVDDAFRGTSVFTDNQGHQTLFVSGVGYGIANIPPSLMNTSDGAALSDIPQTPGTTMGDINQLTTTSDPHPLGMRASVQFNNTFLVSITGGQGRGSLFASTTPLQGNNTFRQITPPDMAVWEIASFNNHLYISLASPQGYGVVRTDCTVPPPGQNYCPGSAFKMVIPFGAGIPGNPNNDVESMTVYSDPGGVQHLYVGAGVNPPGSAPGITPTATPTNVLPGSQTGAELTRINTDDSWDLIVGTPRTVNGVTKQPLSGQGEGFNNINNKYMWSMDSYNGALYVGTWNVAYTGCQLWTSPDGIGFQPITTDGFGNGYCAGIRTTRGTPYGLFVGTVDDYNGLQVWEGMGGPPASTGTPTRTPTPTQTAMMTSTSTPTVAGTSTPTATATPTETAGNTPTTAPTEVGTSMPTSTPSPTELGTSIPGLTPAVWLPIVSWP